MTFRHFAILPVLAFLTLLSACAAPEAPSFTEEKGRDWSLSMLADESGRDDDCEGVNRSIFAVQYAFMAYIIRPIGGIYGSIMPRFMVRGFANLCRNLEFPRRAVSCLVTGKVAEAGTECARFGINTTLGIAGFFDVAENVFRIHEHDEDFAEAFQRAGMARGATVVLPKAAGITLRDALGAFCDILLDGKTYIPYAGSFATLNGGVAQYRSFIRLIEANSDPYEVYKTFSAVQRQCRYLDLSDRSQARRDGMLGRILSGSLPLPPVRRAMPRPEGFTGHWIQLHNYFAETPEIDTLRAAMCSPQQDDTSIWPHLSLFNTDFTRQARFGAVSVLPERSKMDYYFWEQPDDSDAPVAVIVPGIASCYTNPTAVALAEHFYRAGFQSATISNAFSWQFLESAGSSAFPGRSIRDAADVKRAIFAMLDDIAADYGCRPNKIVLVGYSLGALHLLHMSAQEAPQDKYRIDRYIAINPPADLIHALRVADEYAATGRTWTRAEAREKAAAALGTYFALSSMTHPVYDPAFSEKNPGWRYRFPADPTQAKYLCGLSLRMALRDILYTAVKRYGKVEHLKTPYSWSRRTPLYREIDAMSFEKYLELFVLAEHCRETRKETTAAQLGYRSGLRAIAPGLRQNERIRVLHNYNDFLLSEADKKFLDATFGERLSWFDNGGHLGNLYTKQFIDTLLAAAPETPEEFVPAPLAKPE